MEINTQDLLKMNEDFKRYCEHWGQKNGDAANDVAEYAISKLYAKQLLEKEEEKHYEGKIRQDNGID